MYNYTSQFFDKKTKLNNYISRFYRIPRKSMKNQANDSQLYSQSKPRVLLQIPFYLLEKSLEIGRSRRTVASCADSIRRGWLKAYKLWKSGRQTGNSM